MDKNTIQREVLEMIKSGRLKAAISQINTMEWNKTGSWRALRPVYETKNAPCKVACPAMENIPIWIDLIKRGKIKDAWRAYISENPFPAICGRVCFKFCEEKCNRGKFDEPVAINVLEKFLGDQALINNWRPSVQTEKEIGRVAIIGAGPAGLASAYFLRRNGFKVEIYEDLPEPGGLLRIGIPDYRLPKAVLWREVQNNILSLGIGSWFGSRITAESLIGLRQSYDRVIIATGAPISRQLGIEGENFPGIITGLNFLKRVKTESIYGNMDIGPRVAVIGGGNTAIDSARSAWRLKGVKRVMVLYRRSEQEMPAHKEEVEEARNEGVDFKFLTAPVKIILNSDGYILVCQKMRLGESDEKGRFRPIPISGSEFEIAVDTVVKAIGEEKSGIFEPNEKTLIIGDAFSGPLSVIHAIASGKEAAKIISGDNSGVPPLKIVDFSDLNCDYFEKIPRNKSEKLPRPERINNFFEVNAGFNSDDALKEATRCFDCGLCNSCNNCFRFCPDAAVIKSDSGYQIKYDYCKGCLICAIECPRNAISAVKEGEGAQCPTKKF